jgi:ribonuclease Z
MSISSAIWKQVTPIKIPGTQCTLRGSSWAARNTCFYIPEMDVMLDAGIEHEYIPEHVFVTHGHSDHSKNIPQTIIQLGNIKSNCPKKVNIYIPKEIEEYTRNYIDAFYVMSKNNPKHRAHTKYNLIPVEANTRIVVTIRNIKHIIEIIKCFHTVPCVGYGFIQIRNRLKEEYKELQGKEIAVIRKSGIEVTEEYEHPLFCYIGDTNEWVFTNPVLMCECSFITDEQLEQAKRKKHIHIQNIEHIIHDNKDKTFILYHFSDRYETQQIIDFFEGKNYPNVVPWITLNGNTNKNKLPWSHHLIDVGGPKKVSITPSKKVKL